jgi:sulfotransferase family protein
VAEQLKVVYVLGAARSGTSLLTSLLGELDGVFAAAEMRILWKEHQSRLCGCGAPIAECPVWGEVVRAAKAESGLDDPGQFMMLQAATTRIRHLPQRLIRGAIGQADTYLRVMESMYLSLSEASGAGVIVDSSKSPAEAVLLDSSRSTLTYLIHVVRDPRGVAYSWERVGRQSPAKRKSALKSAATWVASNAAAELAMSAHPVERRIRVKYEDYVIDPAATLAKVARLVGIDPGKMDFLRGSAPRVSRHMVGGNALRFVEIVTLNPDTEWHYHLPASRAALVVAATFPLFVRYGYFARPSWRGTAGGSAATKPLEGAP